MLLTLVQEMMMLDVITTNYQNPVKIIMMTSSIGNIFRVTGPLLG